MNSCQYTTDVPDPLVSELWRELHPWACVAEPEIEYSLQKLELSVPLREWLVTRFVPTRCWQKDDAGMAWCQR